MLDDTAVKPQSESEPFARIMRNEDTLESVVTTVAETRPTQFLTWQISRIMYRDFYVLTSCMFRRAKNGHIRKEIQNYLEDLRDEVDVLEHRAANLDMPPLVVHSYADVHIRSHEALRLYLIMMDYDRALFKTLKHVPKKDGDAVFMAFSGTYSKLKRLLIPARKSQSERAASEGLVETK